MSSELQLSSAAEALTVSFIVSVSVFDEFIISSSSSRLGLLQNKIPTVIICEPQR